MTKDKAHDVEGIQLKFFELQEKYKILQKPIISDSNYNSKLSKEYLANITLRWCNEILQKCQKLNEAQEDRFDSWDLKEIRIHIFHNFTNIHGVMIDFWYTTTNTDDEISEESWLSYDVRFWNRTIKEMKNEEHKLVIKDDYKITSGPLGYLLGKPVIMGKYIAVNKSLPLSEKNQHINYFSEDNRELNVLHVLQKRKGLCKLPISKLPEEDYINYGINLVKQCTVHLDNETTLLSAADPLKINFTTICLQLQDAIHEQLFGNSLQLSDISSYHISRLGKPENRSENWLSLNIFNADFNQPFGQYIPNSGTFICRNILLSLAYEFHIGYMVDNGDGDGIKHQNTIEHASLIMGERHDLEFALDELLEVPLAMSVRFYDVNEKAVSASSYIIRCLLMYLISLVITIDA